MPALDASVAVLGLLVLTLLSMGKPGKVQANESRFHEEAWLPHVFHLQSRKDGPVAAVRVSSLLFQLRSNATVTGGQAAGRCGLHAARLPSYRELRAFRRAVSAAAVDDLFRSLNELRFLVDDIAGYALALAEDRFQRILLTRLKDSFVRVTINCVICLRPMHLGEDSTVGAAEGQLPGGDGLDIGEAIRVLIVLLSVAASALVGLFLILLCVNACHLVCQRSAVAIGNSDLEGLVAGNKTSVLASTTSV